MKIRTDFVTNSSSSSFVSVTVTTKDGKCLEGGFDSGNNAVDDIDYIRISPEFFENMKNLDELVELMQSWFRGMLACPELCDDYDYSQGKIKEISQLNIGDIQKIEVSSNIECNDASSGVDITYNYVTKKYRKKKNGDYDPDRYL